jgi:hypothetical protein
MKTNQDVHSTRFFITCELTLSEKILLLGSIRKESRKDYGLIFRIQKRSADEGSEESSE